MAVLPWIALTNLLTRRLTVMILIKLARHILDHVLRLCPVHMDNSGCIQLGMLFKLFCFRSQTGNDISAIAFPKWVWLNYVCHDSDDLMSKMASQITSVSIVYLTVCSGQDQRKHQSSASLAFVRGHRWVPPQSASNAENVSFDDVIMVQRIYKSYIRYYCVIALVSILWIHMWTKS